MKVILGLIIVVFIFYFGSIRGRDKAERLAEVDGTSISYVEFVSDYQKLLDSYRQMYGNQLTDSMIKSMNLKEAAFERLIGRTILLKKARDYKISVSDEEIKQAIAKYPAFQREGVFDVDLYGRVLRQNRLSPEEFEDSQLQMITIKKLEDLIKEGVKISDKEIFDLYRSQNEQVNLRFITVPIADIKKIIKPSEEELEKYLQEKSEQYRMPRKITGAYIAFLGETYGKSLEASPREIEEYYEANKAAFKKQDGTERPLAEVSGTIKQILQTRKGMVVAQTEAKKAYEIIYQRENFDAYAQEHKLAATPVEFSENEQAPSPFSSIDGLPAEIFSLKKGETSRLHADERGYYLFKVVADHPSYIPKLPEVREAVRRDYIDQEAQVRAKAKAESYLAQLAKGATFEEVAKSAGRPLDQTELFVPAVAIPKLGNSAELAAVIPELSKEHPLPKTVFLVDDRYIVTALKERGGIDDKDFMAKRDDLRKSLLTMKSALYFESWLAQTKASMIEKGTLKILKNPQEF